MIVVEVVCSGENLIIGMNRIKRPVKGTKHVVYLTVELLALQLNSE